MVSPVLLFIKHYITWLSPLFSPNVYIFSLNLFMKYYITFVDLSSSPTVTRLTCDPICITLNEYYTTFDLEYPLSSPTVYTSITCSSTCTPLHQTLYTQTKKKRLIFMVLYLSIQLRCCNKNKTKMFIKRQAHKKW